MTLWKNLNNEDKKEYKRMMLAFASLTRMFAQKSDSDKSLPTPILNSKYQETVFQRVFNANIEDIGNTAYDASIKLKNKNYLIGLKTFGLKSNDQKVAQFKSSHYEFAERLEAIRTNSLNEDGSYKTVQEINHINHDLYLSLAKSISKLRNKRIKSAEANIQGFEITDDKEIESVYHVLMPSCIDNFPEISVGEISYDYIDINNIEIQGCTNANTPANFNFSDGKHRYRFTSADSQLLMHFQNMEIIVERWPVIYADDAYSFFADIADRLYKRDNDEEAQTGVITESYSWSILNRKGEVEYFSGFNGFNGVGSKLSKDERKKKIDFLEDEFSEFLDDNKLEYVVDGLNYFFFDNTYNDETRKRKYSIRNEIMDIAKSCGNDNLSNDVQKSMYRPMSEMYIPIPNSHKFHMAHPDFFVKDGLDFNAHGGILNKKEERVFNLVFEPSGNKIECFIAEDWGKAIESTKSMKTLGEWILYKVFQLEEHEPLTAEKLNEVGINGIRLYKVQGSDDVHLQFIWIDANEDPEDFWK